MKFDILNRWSGSVVFTAEIECAEDAPTSVKLGLAVKVAVKADANLADANLAGANLAGAYLARANLAGANLAGAYLAGAYLADAYLADANLAGADLARAYLADANLADAYLADANLAGADLAGAYLAGAYLADAYLADANLVRAKWRNGVVINRQPLFIGGLCWRVFILDAHMQIGCELHSLAEWAGFDDRRILQMDGKNALEFWRQWKAPLLAMAAADGRGVEKVAA